MFNLHSTSWLPQRSVIDLQWISYLGSRMWTGLSKACLSTFASFFGSTFRIFFFFFLISHGGSMRSQAAFPSVRPCGAAGSSCSRPWFHNQLLITETTAGVFAGCSVPHHRRSNGSGKEKLFSPIKKSASSLKNTVFFVFFTNCIWKNGDDAAYYLCVKSLPVPVLCFSL